jgi:hypothetical protein
MPLRSTLIALTALAAVACTDETAPDIFPDAAARADSGPAAADSGAPDREASDASPDDAGADARVAAAFTVVVLPDTQFYAQAHAEIFEAQTRWIMQHAREQEIAFVLHEGDIVDQAFNRGQWEVAARALHALDGVVPYVLAAGNHDLLTGMMGLTTDAPLMNEFFPASRFMQNPWFKGTFEPDRIQNSFQLLPGGGRDWLVLSLEFGPRDAVLAWADALLTQHPTTPAILVTHAYMYIHGERYDRTKPGACNGGQCFGPHNYGLPEPVNDGEEMWQKLVSKHDNVHFVLSGHMTGNAASRRRSERASGSHVHEILANYQSCAVYAPGDPNCIDGDTLMPTRGGDGYLRLMRFDPGRHTVEVKTYSPFLDRWKHNPSNEFVLDLDD